MPTHIVKDTIAQHVRKVSTYFCESSTLAGRNIAENDVCKSSNNSVMPSHV